MDNITEKPSIVKRKQLPFNFSKIGAQKMGNIYGKLAAKISGAPRNREMETTTYLFFED
jgi:hypothetical protein